MSFVVVEREENRQKTQLITGISGFGFFWSRNGRFVTHMLFSKKSAETPNNYKVFVHLSFLFFSFLSSLSFQIPFPYLCFLFVFNINVFLKKKQVQKTPTLVKRGVATKGFFINLCFANCEKLSFFCIFLARFFAAFQKHYKCRYFSTF